MLNIWMIKIHYMFSGSPKHQVAVLVQISWFRIAHFPLIYTFYVSFFFFFYHNCILWWYPLFTQNQFFYIKPFILMIFSINHTPLLISMNIDNTLCLYIAQQEIVAYQNPMCQKISRSVKRPIHKFHFVLYLYYSIYIISCK